MSNTVQAPWLMRVASRSEVGAGHVSRCFTLAKVLAKHVPVQLVLDQGAEHWLPRVSANGILPLVEGARLAGPYSGSLLDGYEFSEHYIEDLARNAPPLAVMDDFLKPPPCAALVINGAPHLSGESINGIPALLGSRFALVGSDFSVSAPRPVPKRLEHIVVTFGTRDQQNMTAVALSALAIASNHWYATRVTVVMDSRAPHLDSVRETIQHLTIPCDLRLDETNMPTLVRSADLIIGAAGTSLLERMACGVPSITIATSENQCLVAEGATRLGGTSFAGKSEEVTPTSLANLIVKIADSPQGRTRMSEKGRELVDGQGANRIATALIELASSHDMTAYPPNP